jgi:quinol monooxygenase YgiN
MCEPTSNHIAIWEFLVEPSCESRFEQIYGPDGDWVQLFRRGDGHLGTELYRDANTPRRYITIDRWVSPQAFETFRQKFATEYKALDESCESLTEKETPLGTFHPVGSRS